MAAQAGSDNSGEQAWAGDLEIIVFLDRKRKRQMVRSLSKLKSPGVRDQVVDIANKAKITCSPHLRSWLLSTRADFLFL